MTRSVFTNVLRYPCSSGEPQDLFISNGLVQGWYPSGSVALSQDDIVHDMNRHWICSTFVDSHLHLLYTEQYHRQIQVQNLISTQLEQILSESLSETIIGHGWRDPFPETLGPDPRRFLDTYGNGRPVLLWNADFHRVLVSSAVLELSGFNACEHSGILVELEAEKAWNVIKPDPAQDVPGACQRLLRNGISAATTFDRGESIKALTETSPGDFGVYVRHGVPEEEFIESCKNEIPKPWGSRHDDFAARWIKIFLDGTLGSRTAWMKSDYSDDPGNTGVVRRSGESLTQTAITAGAAGWGLAIHAIGDAAVAEASRAISVARSRRESVDISDRIEHLQLLDPADIPRIRSSGAVASLQPCHLYEDRQWMRSRWGLRSDHAIPFRELLDESIPVITGTDAPVESLDPWADIYAAVNRMDRNGNEKAEGPNQRVQFREAFHSKTAGAAEANYLPEGYGTLASGSSADFQILDRNPEAVTCLEDSGLSQVYTRGVLRWSKGECE